MLRYCFWIALLCSSIALGGQGNVYNGPRVPLIHTRRGYLRNMRGGSQVPVSPKNRDAKSAARKFLLRNKAFGMEDTSFDLSVERVKARGVATLYVSSRPAPGSLSSQQAR